MTQPLLIIAADTHLRPITWSRYPELAHDAYDSLRQLGNIAVEHRVPLLLLGDIFDKARPDSESVTVFREVAELLDSKNLPLYYIQGNHDYATPPWPSVVATNARCLHNTRVVLQDGTRIVGLDYQRADELEAAVKGLDALRPFDFVCTHQAWAELQGVGNTQGSITLFQPGDRVLTGDYHIRKDIAVDVGGGNVYVHSPGSTALQAIDEPEDKYCGVLTRGASGYELESVKLNTRKVYRTTVFTEQDFQSLLQSTFAEQAQKPILRVTYPDTIADAFSRLVATVGDKAFLFVKQTTTEQESEEVAVKPQEAAVTLADALRAVANGKDVTLPLSLIQNKDINTVLTLARERYHSAAQTNSASQLLQPS